ncbi:AAA family ATPase [Konateibacter massiliensis]|uniref:AAA family ATPase n=1 Tax=Konateibacter massiliensis TaxID=2002841 RepID=UPI000C14E2A4|nr:AAA family ATPase [Konateibacter massiliensis]
MNKNESMLKQIIAGMSVSLGVSIVTGIFQIMKSMKMSTIQVGEWDNSYNNVNKQLYKLDPKTYIKHRTPTTNQDFYELSENISYFIRLKNNNYLKVETFRDKNDKTSYPEHRLKISFFGKEKYKNREEFLKNALKMTDDKHIRVQYLNEFDMSCDVIPHTFDNIVLNNIVRDRIVKGLSNWEKSKEWYEKHQLVHKIGVFLYGKPGTGKSTIAKAISSMFSNAPILTIDPDNIMNSVNGILRTRKKYSGTIIVLVEDFDLFFKSREEIENVDLNVLQKKQKDTNQNAIFQLLDGVYSTDNTIYIATTNYKERIDSALIRYGRFDIQEEIEYFCYNDALNFVQLLGYNKSVLDSFELEYPVQPSYLQSKVMEYRARNQKDK